MNDEAQVCFIVHATHDTRPVRAPILRAPLYAAECVEGVFSEVRRYGVLRSSPSWQHLAWQLRSDAT
jgi:hypothetical protein